MQLNTRQQPTKDHHIQYGTVVRLRKHVFVLVDAQKGAHQWIHSKTGRSISHEQFAARMREDENNLFDPLDTDKENNND